MATWYMGSVDLSTDNYLLYVVILFFIFDDSTESLNTNRYNLPRGR